MLLVALLTSATAWAQDLTITSADDWDNFATAVNSGTSYSGQTVTLTNDITVTTMAGTSTNKFSGTFLGNEHTLTLNLTTDGSEYTAPFRYVDGATIKLLHTAGKVDGGNQKFATGLIGSSDGIVNITACRSSVAISSNRSSESDKDATHGGFIGVAGGTVTFNNCLFDGSITDEAATNCGGFVGWRNGMLTFNNCLQNGTLSIKEESGSAIFNRNGGATLYNCYYKTSYGDVQGTQANATGDDLQKYLGSGWQVSGGSVVPVMDAKNLDIATISGVRKNYPYTGSDITVSYTVTAADGTVLAKGTHYTESFSTANVKEVGSYTLTVSGTGDYSGSQTFSFNVNDGIRYLEYDASDRTYKTGAVPGGATTVTATAGITDYKWGADNTETWYIIEGAVTRKSPIEINGTVNLVLCNGATFSGSNAIYLEHNATLNIYAQTDDDATMGQLTVTGSEIYNPAIGPYWNRTGTTVNIHGGKINATGGNYTAGIGGCSRTSGGAINIYGGIITAQGGKYAAGIGCGYGNDNGVTSVSIYGGQISATGGQNAAGIGMGKESPTCSVFLSWTTSTYDRIYASSYSGTVTIDPGHSFKLSDTNADATTSNIGGQTIVPAQAVTYTVTFDTGGGTAVSSQGIVSGQTATQPGAPVKQGSRFQKWQLSGSDYDFSTPVTGDITLSAVWTALPDIEYINTSNTSSTLPGTDYYPLEPSQTTLNGGTWVVMDDATTFTSRITVKNNVTIILTDGKTLTAQKGISVTDLDNASLTVLAQSGGTGALTVTGVVNQNDACIGGDGISDRYTCGTVSIYGGRITTSGNYMGAGIGGAYNSGASGTICILGGQVDVTGSQWGGHAIGYGYNSSTATATITLGWRNETDYILLHPGSNGSACCNGTVTLASNFLLDGTSTKARWTSESDNNINSHKLVPNTANLMDWADIQAALTAGGTITLTNDVSSASGDKTLVVPAGKTATIDLCGHTLTHNYAVNADASNVDVINVQQATAALTIRSTGSTGHIAGNIKGISNYGTLTMTNVALSGFGGYAIDNQGTLTMSDISVTGNTGGGIYNTGTLNLAGKVTVTGNTLESSACNVYIDSQSFITLAGSLTSDSRIGVDGGSDFTFTSGANGKAVLANFTSDDAKRYICWTTDGSEIQRNRYYYINERDGTADLVSQHQGEKVPVLFTRSFTSGVTSTICLPFQIYPQDYKDYGTFYTFSSVDKTTSPWTVTMTELSDISNAGTPLIFKPSATGSVTFKPYGGSLTIASSYTAGTTTVDDWTFTGVYEKKVWDGDDGDNKDYCYAANTVGDNISAGDFVKIGTYVQVKAFRCYLTNEKLSKSSTDLPDKITVVLVDETSSVVNPDDPDTPGDITTPVSEIVPNSGTKVWSYGGTIYIEAQPDTDYQIIDLDGRTLLRGTTDSTHEEISLGRGSAIVIVKINGKTFKVNY